jgi:flagellar biosynthesis GTPase FlhF
MRKVMHVLVIPVAIFTMFFPGCNTADNSPTVKRENAELIKEVEALKAEIHRLKNEPEILFSTAYDEKANNQYDSALEILQRLQQKYPDFQPDKVSSALKEFAQAKVEYEKKQAEEKRIQEQERLKQNALAQATAQLTKSRDEMEEVDWYHSRLSPKTNNSKNIQAYIGKKQDAVWLRFKMTYNASDWLFVQSVSFKVDGEDFELKYSFLDDWERDNSYGGIWEWKDVMVDKYIWNLITTISKSKKAMMRYKGPQYYSDRGISLEEKVALIEVISGYEAMGGKPPQR